MSRQTISIGAEENDGTGEGIRSAFAKINSNFNELYIAVGLSDGVLRFSTLQDGPESYGTNQLFMANSAATKVVGRTLTSGTGIDIDITDDAVTISTVVSGQPSIFSTHVNAKGFTIGNVPNPTDELVTAYNGIYLDDPITIDDLIINKGYADDRYVKLIGSAMTGDLSMVNLAYSGTLTGGTGLINIGSGQIYKTTGGNIGLGTVSPDERANYTSLSLNHPTNGGNISFYRNNSLVGRIANGWNTLRFYTETADSAILLQPYNAVVLSALSTGMVGINTSAPSCELDVIGDISASGTVSALSFIGAGTGLTGTASSLTSGAVTSITSGQVTTALGYTPVQQAGTDALAIKYNSGYSLLDLKIGSNPYTVRWPIEAAWAANGVTSSDEDYIKFGNGAAIAYGKHDGSSAGDNTFNLPISSIYGKVPVVMVTPNLAGQPDVIIAQVWGVSNPSPYTTTSVVVAFRTWTGAAWTDTAPHVYWLAIWPEGSF